MQDLGRVVLVLAPGHFLGGGDHLDVIVRPFPNGRGGLVHTALAVCLRGEKVTSMSTTATGRELFRNSEHCEKRALTESSNRGDCRQTWVIRRDQ